MFSKSVWYSRTHLRILCFSQACATELLASGLESLWEVKGVPGRQEEDKHNACFSQWRQGGDEELYFVENY